VNRLIARMEAKKHLEPESITLVPELMVRGSTAPVGRR